jgi:DNA-binding FadR family transcriptional regulator
MVVEAAVELRVGAPAADAEVSEWGFAVDLARSVGNPAMALAAQFAEMLVRACEGRPAPAHDGPLEHAVQLRDTGRAFTRLEGLAHPSDLAAPSFALEAMERSFAWAGRKSAMALAARMTREIVQQPDKPEAEWETAQRMGYSDAVVRQARRILQDFGVVRCQRGRKGALGGGPASPAGVIRLLAPCFIASGATARDTAQTANFLACNGPRLAAARATGQGGGESRELDFLANSVQLFDMIQIENLLLVQAGNPLLSILTRSLGLANLASPGAKVSLRRRVEIVAINQRILRAIRGGDAAAADLLARAKGDIQLSEVSYRKIA